MKQSKRARRALIHTGGAALVVAAISLPLLVQAAGIPTLDTVDVTAENEDLIGSADTASVGTVTKKQIEARPIYRTGELLETVPGVVVTQHSGEGKANQYFLRGFNLDHGTDIGIYVDDIPVNLRSHAHGQGYSDTNFLIPELLEGLQYKKGTYFADEGDFASAGSLHLNLANTLPRGIASIGAGEDGYARTLLANSFKAGKGNLLYGLELFHTDGPWTHPDDFKRVNADLRYSQGDSQNGFNITGLAYYGEGDATNQIARRAVKSGQIGLFGTLDNTDGSRSDRYLLSGGWHRTQGNSITKVSAYVEKYDLALWSDFTYFLDDQINGDQFEQTDDRVQSGVDIRQTWLSNWGGHDVENTIGLQFRNDDSTVGLFKTARRSHVSTTRLDDITESSVGLYAENRTTWLPKFRTVAGLRADYFTGTVDGSNNTVNPAASRANSGEASDSIVNPKLSLIFGPWAKTEYYVSAGGGYHSNDIRGTTFTTDPTSDPSDVSSNISKVPFLVRSKGAEIGLRSALVPHLQTSLSFYALDFDSELVFVGDAGNTEPGRPSRRVGFELSNYYTPTNWLTLDADLAYAAARFTARDPLNPTLGNHIPGAVEGVVSVGAEVDNLGPWFGALRARYFGPRPLEEDNNERSPPITILEGRIGYKINKDLRISLDGFNLLDSKADQITYFYESQLKNADGTLQGAVEDQHFHPVESRTFRLNLVYNFD